MLRTRVLADGSFIHLICCLRCSWLLVAMTIATLGLPKSSFSQNVGIGTATPNAKAQLEITSTNKGILIPRLTTNQRNNIVNPPAGLMIYNTTTDNYNVYDSVSWKAMQKELPPGVMVLAGTGPNAGLSELGFSSAGHMYMSYRPPSTPATIPDSTWFSINQDDPDSLNSILNSGSIGSLFWTGNEAVYLRKDSSFKYNPVSDKWSAYANIYNGIIFSGTLPPCVWTGTEAFFWDDEDRDHVYRFNSQTNTFTTLTASFPWAAPAIRTGYSLLWAGDKMIMWGGGYQNNGAVYYPGTNLWFPVSMPSALQSTIAGRNNHAAVWTGTEMIVVGGEVRDTCMYGFPPTTVYTRTINGSGFRFNPNTFQFNPISGGFFRAGHTLVWTGTEMIAFGGYFLTGGGNCTYSNTASNAGAKYNLSSNTWTNLPVPSGLPARMNHAALWNGTRMIVLGGQTALATVNCYNPSTNTWTNEISDCPAVISLNRSIYTGDRIISMTRPSNFNNNYIWFHAFSSVPVNLMQSQSISEIKFAVWLKN